MIGTTYTLVEYSDWLELARQQQNVVVLLLMGIFTLFVGIIGIVGANRLQRSDGNLNNIIEERNNLPEYKADSGLDDDTKNVKKLLEKDDFKKKAELAYIDSHGYSTVQV